MKIADISNLKNDNFKIIFFTLLHYLSRIKGCSVQYLIPQLGHSFSHCLQRTLLAVITDRPNIQAARSTPLLIKTASIVINSFALFVLCDCLAAPSQLLTLPYFRVVWLLHPPAYKPKLRRFEIRPFCSISASTFWKIHPG